MTIMAGFILVFLAGAKVCCAVKGFFISPDSACESQQYQTNEECRECQDCVECQAMGGAKKSGANYYDYSDLRRNIVTFVHSL